MSMVASSRSYEDVIGRNGVQSNAQLAMNGGNKMLLTRNFKAAFESYWAALRLLPPQEHDLRLHCHIASAAVSFELGYYKKALDHAEKAGQEIQRSCGHQPFCLEEEICHQYSAMSFLKLGRPRKAIKRFELALKTAQGGSRHCNVSQYKQTISKCELGGYPMDNLPEELIGKILEYADLPSRIMFACCSKRFHSITFGTGHLRIWPLTKGPLFSSSDYNLIEISTVSTNDIVMQESLWFRPRRPLKERFRCGNPLFYQFVDQFVQNITTEHGNTWECADRLLQGISVYFGRFVRKRPWYFSTNTNNHLLTRDEIHFHLHDYLMQCHFERFVLEHYNAIPNESQDWLDDGFILLIARRESSVNAITSHSPRSKQQKQKTPPPKFPRHQRQLKKGFSRKR